MPRRKPDPTPPAPQYPAANPLDRVDPTPNPLIAIGSGGKPLGPLVPIFIKPQITSTGRILSPKPQVKPMDKKFELERVSLFAKEQISCPVPFTQIRALRISDTQYRLNFLAPDKAAPKVIGLAAPKPINELDLVIWKYVYSCLVRVAWGGKDPILTKIGEPIRNHSRLVD